MKNWDIVGSSITSTGYLNVKKCSSQLSFNKEYMGPFNFELLFSIKKRFSSPSTTSMGLNILASFWFAVFCVLSCYYDT